jgi:hypothetical protein
MTHKKPHLYRIGDLWVCGTKRALGQRWLAGVGRTPVEAYRDYVQIRRGAQ